MIKGVRNRGKPSSSLWGTLRMQRLSVSYAAGIVISRTCFSALYDVNVNGTRNIIALCREKNVKRLVYVSSVHAIPEQEKLQVLEEVQNFSP